MSVSEEEFLNTIFEHQALIHKVCHLYRDRKEDREDLFQEITYQLWKSYPKFEGRSKITTWMYRICLNTAIASFRKPEIKTTDVSDFLEPLSEAEEEGNFQKEQLFSAIRKLDDAEKAIITLYLEGLDHTEISQIIGVTKNNLSVRLNRIKNKIRILLNT